MEKVSNWKTRTSHKKKPRLTKQTLNTDFINCIWPYFTRLAAASFVKLTNVCLVFPCPKTILSCGKPLQLLELLCRSNFLALGIAEFRRALALCCTGRHVQAAVNTKLPKRRKERHGTTEFSRELAFEQGVMDTRL